MAPASDAPPSNAVEAGAEDAPDDAEAREPDVSANAVTGEEGERSEDSLADDSEFADDSRHATVTQPPEDRYPEPDEEDDNAREHHVRYFLEDIEVTGNTGTRDSVILSYIPLELGDVIDPEDPSVEAIKWRLRGTGWFRSVRLRLKRGSRRGWVVLVVEVEEQNTIVVTQLALGVSEGITRSEDRTLDLVPYLGATVEETNLFGTGMRLSVSGLVSTRGYGLRVGLGQPRLRDTSYGLQVSAFFNDARQFFGNDPLVSISCPSGRPRGRCPPEVEARNAVVIYRRGGVSLAAGRDIGSNLRVELGWQGEFVNVRARPAAASETRGTEVRPIDFAINDNVSYVSLARLRLVYDRRDDPAMPTRGTRFFTQVEGASILLGSDYSFLRMQASVRTWVPVRPGHVLRFGGYLGAAFGDTPFYFKFHISDLSDLIPSRVLEMELDRRPAPDILNTSIAAMRNEELAARLDVQYELRLYTSRGRLRGVYTYVNLGLIALADLRDPLVAPAGYTGIGVLPIDLTFDVGVRFDTVFGVFQFGFSNLLGFISL